jgi:hypothetical protein
MAVATVGSGRPYFVADIDFVDDPDMPLWDEFHQVCKQFHYREVMAVSRAFGVDPVTVRRWKYGISYPSRRGIAVLVILWVKNGKPMIKVPPSQSPVSTL